MFRLKTLSVLAGIIAALALSAATASAEFQSTAKPVQSQGNVTVLKEGAFKDEGVPVKCPAAEIKAQYHIQAKGQIKAQQTETTNGPHLALQVKSWGKACTAEILGSKVAAKVKPECDLQLEQRQKTEAAGGVATACVIAVGTVCELQVPTGMETKANTGQGINVGLTTVELTNSGANLIAKANVEHGGVGQLAGDGIFVVPQPGHPLCPIATNEKGELTGLEGELLGINS